MCCLPCPDVLPAARAAPLMLPAALLLLLLLPLLLPACQQKALISDFWYDVGGWVCLVSKAGPVGQA